MDLSALIRLGPAIASIVTRSAQVPVIHEPWEGQDVSGDAAYGDPVTRYAIVEYKTKQFPSGSAQLQLIRAVIYFLDPIPDHGVGSRIEPLDTRDKLTLPDGTTGPILSVDGIADPSTTHPYYYAVNLGWFIR